MYDVDPRQGSLDEVDAGWFGTDEGTLPIGAPFRPGLDPLPVRVHEAWAVVKDRWGRPAHGEPREALRRVATPIPTIGPNEALGYVLYAGLTYNTNFAARGVPVSVFDMHDRDCHVPGSGAVVLVAALGSEVAREARLKVGELRVLYPGVSNLLSPRAGEDPMHADFKYPGIRDPRWLVCPVRALPGSPASGSLGPLDARRGLVLHARSRDRVQGPLRRGRRPARRARVRGGAAGGTGIYAVLCAALRGARVTGLVSTEEKARLIRERGASGHVNRKAPGLAGIFTPVPSDAAGRESLADRPGSRWSRASARRTTGPDRRRGVLVGRELSGRMVDLLAPGAAYVFYGATSGYTISFLGKPGASRPPPRCWPPVCIPTRASSSTTGSGVAVRDPRARSRHPGGLRCGPASSRPPGPTPRPRRWRSAFPWWRGEPGDAAARHGLPWPETMPDYDTDRRRGLSRLPGRTRSSRSAKPSDVFSRRRDNPRGYPDWSSSARTRDTLGVSTFLARPFTGRVVYARGPAGRRFSFYAPNVWMHQKRVAVPDVRDPGSHLSNAHQADEVVRLLDAGALTRTHPPVDRAGRELAEANQTIHENRHAGTLTVRVGATRRLDGARTARAGIRGVGLTLRRRQGGARAHRSGAAGLRRRAWRW